jgi:hypothetical protein
MATAASHLKGEHIFVTSPFTMSVADSVDGLLYMPDASNPRKLIVAAGNVFCGFLMKKAKIGDSVSLIIIGSGPAVASGAISAYAPVTVDSGGKCKAASVGSDQVIGYNDGPATTTDGDVFTLTKIA